MKLSVRNFALGTSFLVMGILLILGKFGLYLTSAQVVHVAMCWVIVNMIFILIKILSHE